MANMGYIKKKPLLRTFLENHTKKAYNNLVKELPLLENPDEEGVKIED